MEGEFGGVIWLVLYWFYFCGMTLCAVHMSFYRNFWSSKKFGLDLFPPGECHFPLLREPKSLFVNKFDTHFYFRVNYSQFNSENFLKTSQWSLVNNSGFCGLEKSFLLNIMFIVSCTYTLKGSFVGSWWCLFPVPGKLWHLSYEADKLSVQHIWWSTPIYCFNDSTCCGRDVQCIK